MSETLLRDARAEDAEAIAGIYNHYVARSTCTFEDVLVTVASRAVWLREREPRHPVLVLEAAGAVVGWAALSPHRPRGAYRATCEFSIYLHPEACGRGHGRALLAELVVRARAGGHHALLGGTCTESAASMRLQESFGFERVGVFREVGQKFGRWLDVAYYELRLG